jgi:hypothetical protein
MAPAGMHGGCLKALLGFVMFWQTFTYVNIIKGLTLCNINASEPPLTELFLTMGLSKEFPY